MTTKNNGEFNRYKTIVSVEAYREFAKLYPNHRELGMNYWVIRRILSSMNDLIMEEVYNHPLGFSLPYNFGCLRMIGVKVKSKRTDVTKMKKIDYSRTEGYIYSLQWLRNPKKIRIKRLHFYKFVTAKLVRKAITKKIREDGFFNWTKLVDRKDIKRLNDY